MGSSLRRFTLRYMKGDSNGMRTAAGSGLGSAAMVLVFRRDELQEIKKELKDLPKSGVYVLSGIDPTSSRRTAVYVGKGKVWNRLGTHLNDKDKGFWQDTAVLVTKNIKLSTGHLDNLEALLIDELGKVQECNLHNKQKRSENPGNLEDDDHEMMVQLLKDSVLLFDALNSRVFRKVTRKRTTKPARRATKPMDDKTENGSKSKSDEIFFAKSESFDATMRYFSDGHVEILKDSVVVPISEHSSLSSMKKIKEKKIELIYKKIIVEKNNKLVFNEDYICKSSSQAANLVSGSSRSGPEFWKTHNEKKGKNIKLKEYIRKNNQDESLPKFYLGKDKYKAQMFIYPNRKCLVIKGSKARKNHRASASKSLIAKRKSLTDNKVLEDDGINLVFRKDHSFRSPNEAATVVAGGNTDVNASLKLSDGTTYGQWAEKNK